MSDLKDVIAKLPQGLSLSWADMKGDRRNPKEVNFVLNFSEPGYGFGEITVVQTKKGIFIDGETMPKEKVKKFLNQLVDMAIMDRDDDPERHKLYNEVMERRCGESCRICHP